MEPLTRRVGLESSLCACMSAALAVADLMLPLPRGLMLVGGTHELRPLLDVAPRLGRSCPPGHRNRALPCTKVNSFSLEEDDGFVIGIY
jgi:hypothetical protein